MFSFMFPKTLDAGKPCVGQPEHPKGVSIFSVLSQFINKLSPGHTFVTHKIRNLIPLLLFNNLTNEFFNLEENPFDLKEWGESLHMA